MENGSLLKDNIIVINHKNLNEVYDFINNCKKKYLFIGLDTETSGLDPFTEVLLCITLGNEYVQYFISWDEQTRKVFDKSIFNDCLFTGQFLKFDYKFLYRNGFKLENTLPYDLMLASQIVYNGVENTHSLERIALRELNTIIDKTMQTSFIGQRHFNFTNEQITYACVDVKYLNLCQRKLQQKLRHTGQLSSANLDFQLLPVLSQMELRGVDIDVVKYRHLIASWNIEANTLLLNMDEEIAKLAEKNNKKGGKLTRKRNLRAVPVQGLFDFATPTANDLERQVKIQNQFNKGNINFASPKQVLALFDTFETPKPVNQEGKISLQEDTLELWITENPEYEINNFLKMYLEYKKMQKRISSYGEKFLNRLQDGKIFTSYSQCFTDTGRLSSQNINLQNIPRIKEIRECFIAPEGYSFVTADCAGQETKIAADFSRDDYLLPRCGKEDDVHSEVASATYSIIFQKPVTVNKSKDEIAVYSPILEREVKYSKKYLRDEHKAILFLTFYGGGAKKVYAGLAKFINLFHPPNRRMEIAKEISNSLKNYLLKLNKYLQKQVEIAKSRGYIDIPTGRRRYFKNRENIYGEAMNFPIQATGAEAMKKALVDLDAFIKKKAKELNVEPDEIMYPVMTVHDEVVVAISDKYLDYAEHVPRIMSESLSFYLTTVKGESDYSISKFWQK